MILAQARKKVESRLLMDDDAAAIRSLPLSEWTLSRTASADTGFGNRKIMF
jgi:hypothetical protein